MARSDSANRRRAAVARALAVTVGLCTVAAACNRILDLPDRALDAHLECDDEVCSCAPGFADCDGLEETGCETDLGSTAHCGACGQACVGGDCVAGSCQCREGFADCNGSSTDGCEVSVRDDARHCGSCGHDCLGGECVEFACTAFPLAVTSTEILASAFTDDEVYLGSFCESPLVTRVALDDGAVSVLVPESACLTSFALHEGVLHAAVDERIVRIDEAGALATVVAEQAHTSLAADATSLFWWRTEPDLSWRLRRYRFDTGTTEDVLTRDLLIGGRWDVESSFGCWSENGNLLSCTRLDAPTGRPQYRVLPGGAVHAIEIQDPYVYFTVIDVGVARAFLDGRDNPTLLVEAKTPVAIALDGETLYYADEATGGVYRMALPRGSPALVATDQVFGFDPSIWVDTDAVYWVARDRVMKVAK